MWGDMLLPQWLLLGSSQRQSCKPTQQSLSSPSLRVGAAVVVCVRRRVGQGACQQWRPLPLRYQGTVRQRFWVQ